MTLDAAPVALAEQLNDVNSIAPERKHPVHDPPLARALERQARSTSWTVGHGSQLYFAPMASRGLDAGIDNLYQLPLGEFTAARNALAKEAGAKGAEIRSLQKPPVAAWAVNQLFWHDRETYDRLIEAATEVRTAHGAVLAGRKGDLRVSGRLHEDAIQQSLTSTIDILTKSGQPVTEATRQAIATTLRALPSADPPGRLTRTLQPGGFEMLTGVPVRQRLPRKPANRNRHGRTRPRALRVRRPASMRKRWRGPRKPSRSRRARCEKRSTPRDATSSRPPAPRVRLTKLNALLPPRVPISKAHAVLSRKQSAMRLRRSRRGRPRQRSHGRPTLRSKARGLGSMRRRRSSGSCSALPCYRPRPSANARGERARAWGPARVSKDSLPSARHQLTNRHGELVHFNWLHDEALIPLDECAATVVRI